MSDNMSDKQNAGFDHLKKTVPPDDDSEAATLAWVSSVVEARDEVSTEEFVSFGQYDGISLVKLDGDETLQLWCEEYQIGVIKTRGQFRALCKALDIEITEKVSAQ